MLLTKIALLLAVAISMVASLLAISSQALHGQTQNPDFGSPQAPAPAQFRVFLPFVVSSAANSSDPPIQIAPPSPTRTATSIAVPPIPTATPTLIMPTLTPTQVPATPFKTPTPVPPTQTAAPTMVMPTLTPTPAPVKKGIGLTYDHCSDSAAVGAVWQYDWGTNPMPCPGVDNVPMIWGSGSVSTMVSGNSAWIMGFNEPDIDTQSNLTPAQAAPLWRQIEQEYPNRLLLAPAPSHLNPQWIVDFRSAYIARYNAPPRLNGLALHCYLPAPQDCINLTQWYIGQAQQWGVPEVWVTEFAFMPCNGTTTDTAGSQMAMFIQWLDAQPMVTRYAWFAARIQGTEAWSPPPACITPLVDFKTGALTQLGIDYLNQR